MKRILVACVLVGILVGSSSEASSAAAVVERAVPATWVVATPGQPARVITRAEWEKLPVAEKARAVWGDGFRVKAMRAPDGWLEARQAARTITPGQILVGIALGIIGLVTLGALACSLALFLRPRSLSWFGTLTRSRSRAMLDTP